MRVYHRAYYQLDVNGRRSRNYAYSKIARLLRSQFLWGYLEKHPCVDCGETDPMVLQFDHVRGSKSFNVSNAVSGQYSLNRISEEITKCDIRCANCHVRKTALELGFYRWRNTG